MLSGTTVSCWGKEELDFKLDIIQVFIVVVVAAVVKSASEIGTKIINPWEQRTTYKHWGKNWTSPFLLLSVPFNPHVLSILQSAFQFSFLLTYPMASKFNCCPSSLRAWACQPPDSTTFPSCNCLSQILLFYSLSSWTTFSFLLRKPFHHFFWPRVTILPVHSPKLPASPSSGLLWPIFNKQPTFSSVYIQGWGLKSKF